MLLRAAAFVCLLTLGSANAWAQYGQPFPFSGRYWVPKTPASKVGPGPNYFSANNVFVDALGRLHLKITKVGNKWQCAEVVMQGTLGYGTYRFYLDSAVNNLDPNVVLGLFTWNDVPDYNHREMDIEFAKWGVARNNNGWYTVQPYNVSGNQVSFLQPANTPQSIHMFDWFTGPLGNRTAHFSSVAGVSPAAPPYVEQLFTSGVPPTGGENVRINLWLYQGRAPKAPAEIIINKVEFVPQP
jgi:hypothetical protein